MHGDRNRQRLPGLRSVRLFEVLVFAAFVSIVAFCVYDGFKEIFTKPPPFKPKEAEDSIAELKATIAKSKVANPHKYVKAARGERRAALQTADGSPAPPPPPPDAEEDADPGATYTKLIVVSSMQEAACLADGGNELHYLSARNKQDYARIHGYDFVLGIKQVDPKLENMWNKPAWILKVLEDERRQGEWILWVDIDTVILDANFTLPYEEYAAASKDLVVYGDIAQVRAGHPLHALNTGVMLMRNSPWTRHFFSEVCRLGRLDDHHKGKSTLSTILLKELQADAYSDGLRDQNAVIYLLKTHPEWLDRVAFLDKEVCLNCYWRDLIGVTGFGEPEYVRKENVSFVQHFMGCQTCNSLNRNGDIDTCRDAMFHSFRYATQRHAPLLAGAPPRGEGEAAQLRELPFCSLSQAADGCAGARPLNASQLAVAIPTYDWKQVDSDTVASTLQKLKSDDDVDGSAVGGGVAADAAASARVATDGAAQEDGTLVAEAGKGRAAGGSSVKVSQGAASRRKGARARPVERREAREGQRRPRQRKRVRLSTNKASADDHVQR